MKIIKLFFLLIITLTFSCKSQTKKVNGVSFVASRDSISKEHINPVLKSQSNFVALMPYGFIKELATPEIKYNTYRQWFGETKNGLLQYAKIFQKENIRIMVKPHIWVWKGEFTGNIKMSSEENWKILEKSYSQYILAYAKAAEDLNAALFCIGTELEQFITNRPKYWQKLILEIRKVYKGKLTYAANWDNIIFMKYGMI